MSYTLYVLKCPHTNIVRYVGITSQKLQARLYNHLHNKNDNPYKNNWIGSLDKINKTPIIEGLFFGLTKADACALEIETIKKYRSIVGKKLTNILPGGTLPPNHTGRTRTFTEQHKKKISIGCKGRRPYNKGKKMSPNQKKKISEARKKISATQEWKDLRSTWSTARIKTSLVNSDGIVYHITNVHQFCLKHNLDNSSIYRVIRKEKQSYKGWHLCGHRPKSQLTAMVMNQNNQTFFIDSIPQFCKKHNLDLSALYKVVRGVIKNHKGWSLAN